MKTIPGLIIPQLSINGTPADHLTEGYRAAKPLREALEALEGTAPNARDYIDRPRDWAQAQAEHRARLLAVERVRDEIWTLHEDVQEQDDERRASRP